MSERTRTKPVRRASVRWRAPVVAAAVALLGPLVPLSSASGATREFSDPADAPDLDIRAVRVQFGTWLQVTARHQGDVRGGQTYRYYFDTTTAHPGPEYLFVMHPNSDAGSLTRVNGFGDPTGQAVDCGAGWGGSADEFRPQRPVVARVSARCLGYPSRVSVSLRFTGADGSLDWAPGRARRYAWVARN
jgi:hypothetical protein